MTNERSDGDGGSDLARAVHELRQSLGTILMLTGAARMRDDVPEELESVLALIESEVETASDTCRHLLDPE